MMQIQQMQDGALDLLIISGSRIRAPYDNNVIALNYTIIIETDDLPDHPLDPMPDDTVTNLLTDRDSVTIQRPVIPAYDHNQSPVNPGRS